jgi:hypothetical protein
MFNIISRNTNIGQSKTIPNMHAMSSNLIVNATLGDIISYDDILFFL